MCKSFSFKEKTPLYAAKHTIEKVCIETLTMCVRECESVRADTDRRSSDNVDFVDFSCFGMSVQQSIRSLADVFL